MPTRKAGRGFTLVELMVVISIIGVLVTLLMPVVSSARQIVAKAATTKIIKDLSLGLETYKGDFGEYPPSRPYWRWAGTAEKNLCGKYWGAANLVYYLAGPAGNGWGVDAAGRMPYSHLSKSTRSYGPYFKVTPDTVSYDTDPTPGGSGLKMMVAVLDAFKPAGNILYFRYEANPEIDSATSTPKPNYQVSDNNDTQTAEEIGCTTGKKNYYSQTFFLETVRILVYAPTSGNKVYRYVRTDFLLVSPGADGVYGWVKKGPDGLPIPVTRDKTDTAAKGYDDVTNFN